MNYLNKTDDQWAAMIENAPSENDQKEAYETMLQAYKARVSKSIKTFDWGFNDFGNEELRQMFYAVRKFAYDFMMHPIESEKIEPYWLTLLGKSEIGKSHLTQRLSVFLNKYGKIRAFPIFAYNDPATIESSIKFLKASKFSNESQTFKDKYKTDLGDITVLVVDDLHLGVKSWVKDDLCNLFMLRSGEGLAPFRWTVVSSNLTRLQIDRDFDKRTASRMRRNKNVVLELSDSITPFVDR